MPTAIARKTQPRGEALAPCALWNPRHLGVFSSDAARSLAQASRHDPSFKSSAGSPLSGSATAWRQSKVRRRRRLFSWPLLSSEAGQFICRTKPGSLAGLWGDGVVSGEYSTMVPSTWALAATPADLECRSLDRPETARRSTAPSPRTRNRNKHRRLPGGNGPFL